MADDRLAARRFWLMQGCRLLALALVVTGVAAISEQGLDRPQLGYALLVLGAACFFALPLLLSKRWKSR